MSHPTSSPDLFDVLRAKHPHLGFAVYAYTPNGQITLELHVGDLAYTFEAPTLKACLEQAFGAQEEPPEHDIFA